MPPTAPNPDPFNLTRFLEAQAPIHAQALSEIRAGRKTSHWMWFIFPQFRGLGFSATSAHFAISSVDEARAYLAHPVLGPRLLECASALLALPATSAYQVFGSPDDMKLRSCATLFAHASPPESVFEALLAKYFRAEPDQKTLDLLTERAAD
jgi:uncharacterized protein (DUF1810 family)